MATVKDRLIHKRIHIKLSTSLLVGMMADLMGANYQETMEAAVLYGLAYMNEKNKMNMMKWTDELKLPSIKDIEDFMENRLDAR